MASTFDPIRARDERGFLLCLKIAGCFAVPLFAMARVGVSEPAAIAVTVFFGALGVAAAAIAARAALRAEYVITAIVLVALGAVMTWSLMAL
jgi:hypothetical protein